MRTITSSLILAFTVIVSNVSVAGTPGNGIPNAGLFAVGPAPVVVMASR